MQTIAKLLAGDIVKLLGEYIPPLPPRRVSALLLKLLSKFHVARPNRSRVINKSLKLRTR